MATDIYTSLVEIVGEAHVSAKKEELYFYGRDAGLMPAHEPDYVVVPKTTEDAGTSSPAVVLYESFS